MSNNFTDVFKATLADIKATAAKNGVSLKALCKRAGVSRATPDRWLAKPPNTIALMDKLQKAADGTDPAPAADRAPADGAQSE